MVRYIRREDGEFKVGECDMLNFYYEFTYKGIPYAHVHTQLATEQKFAYCHAYVSRFSAELAREIKKDWAVIQDNMRAFGIELAIGTKDCNFRVWKKFVQLVGFKAENIRPSKINDKPCMMAVMEL